MDERILFCYFTKQILIKYTRELISKFFKRAKALAILNIRISLK